MKMVKTFMAALFAVSMLFGLAGTASAVSITCGACHSGPPVDAENCDGDAGGVHVTHYNYSSASYPKSGNMVDGVNTDKCAYCHTATTGTAPTATHNNNYVNVTTTAAAPSLSWNSGTSTCTDACHNNNATTAPWGIYTSVNTVKLSCVSCHDDASANDDLTGSHIAHLGTTVTVSGLGAGTNADCNACHPDNVNDLFSDGMNGKAYPHASDGTNVVSANAELDAGMSHTTCASACHNNTNDSWGGSLTCTSCHSDNTGAGTALPDTHPAHFAKSIDCDGCHVKPATFAAHKSGGITLPVATANVVVDLAGTGSYTDATNSCSNDSTQACHANTATTWGGSLTCTSCHSDETGAGTALTGSHSGHFSKGVTDCAECHVKPATIAAHAAYTLPLASANATITLSPGSYNSGTKSCTGTGSGCHLTGAPTWGTALNCGSCHNYPDGNNWASGNGHAVQYDGVTNTHLPAASNFTATSDQYATVVGNAAKCGKCHSGATHQNSSIDMSATPGHGYCSADFTFNIISSWGSANCSNVDCHSGKQTPEWY